MDGRYRMNAFFFGLGFSATHASMRMLMSGQYADIGGTVRTEEKAMLLRSKGLRAHVFDGFEPCKTLGADLRAAHHVVFSIAPGPEGDPALIQHRADLDAA